MRKREYGVFWHCIVWTKRHSKEKNKQTLFTLLFTLQASPFCPVPSYVKLSSLWGSSRLVLENFVRDIDHLITLWPFWKLRMGNSWTESPAVSVHHAYIYHFTDSLWKTLGTNGSHEPIGIVLDILIDPLALVTRIYTCYLTSSLPTSKLAASCSVCCCSCHSWDGKLTELLNLSNISVIVLRKC